MQFHHLLALIPATFACIPSGGGLFGGGGGCGASMMPAPSGCGAVAPPPNTYQISYPPLPPPPSPLYLSPTAAEPQRPPPPPALSFSSDASPQRTWSVNTEPYGGTYSVTGINRPSQPVFSQHDHQNQSPSSSAKIHIQTTAYRAYPPASDRPSKGESRLRVGNGSLPASYFMPYGALPPAPPTSAEIGGKSENPSVLVAASNDASPSQSGASSYQVLDAELQRELNSLELNDEGVRKALLVSQRLPVHPRLDAINQKGRELEKPTTVLSSRHGIEPTVTELETGEYLISHQSSAAASDPLSKHEKLPNTSQNADDNTVSQFFDAPETATDKEKEADAEAEDEEEAEHDHQVQVPGSAQMAESEERAEKTESATLKPIVFSPKNASESYGAFAVRTHQPDKDYPQDEDSEEDLEMTTRPQFTPYLTYYNQMCDGEVLGASGDETMATAAEKCAELGCEAANARPIGGGRYQVTFLGGVRQRRNLIGSYCVSGKKIPLRREIRRQMRHRRGPWPARANLRIRRIAVLP